MSILKNLFLARTEFRALANPALFALTIVLAIACANLRETTAQENYLQEPTLHEILESFHSEDAETRSFAIGDLEFFDLKTRAERQLAVDALTKLLDDPSIEVRIESVKILRDWGSQNLPSMKIALDGLMADDDRTRAQALYFLSSLASAASQFDQIERALSDPEPNVRSAAAWVLGELGPDHKVKSIPVLTRSLNDPHRNVRGQAAESLAAIDGPLDQAIATLAQLIKDANSNYDDDFPVNLDIISTVEELGIDANETIPVLIESLALGGTHRQCSVAKALAMMGPGAESAIETLGRALRNGKAVGYPFVHHSWCASDDAATALVAIGEKSIPVLIGALDDTDARVRANAANALGDIPSSAGDAMPKLIELLGDDDPTVRSSAAWAMGKLGDHAKTAIPELVSLLFDNTDWNSAPAGGGIAQTFSVPWHAVEAIARIKPDKAILVQALNTELSRRKTINFAVATVISKIGPQAEPLLEELRPMLADVQLRASAAFAATHIKPDATGLLPALTDSLIDSSGEVNRVAARGLRVLGKRASSSIPELYAAIEVAKKDEFVGSNSDLILCALAILFADINQDEVIDVMFENLNTSHSVFDQTAIEAAIKLLPELVTRNMTIRERLNEQLNYRYRPANGADQDGSEQLELTAHNMFVRLRAARILQADDLDQETVIAELVALCQAGKYQIRGEAIELLGLYGSQAEQSVEIICGFLDHEEVYTVGGDFYGNGGEQFTVAQKSIEALAAIGPGAISELTRKLGDANHRIRANAVEALGQMGDPASPALESLLTLVEDPSHHVRRNIAQVFGQIRCEDPELNQRIAGHLKTLSNDRPSIQLEAQKSLQNLPQK